MSFGFYDKDWVDPPEPNRGFEFCCDCDNFEPCPCGCDYGWCVETDEFVDGSEEACEI